MMFKPPLLIKEIWRTGQLKLFSLTLMFVVGSFAASDQIFNLMQGSLSDKVTALMGADRTIVSWRNIPQSWVAKAKLDALGYSRVTQLGSMLASEEGFQLASVSAIDKFYPLAGEILVGKSKSDLLGQLQQRPDRGKIWLSFRLADALNVDVGGVISLGDKDFVISGIIVSEPGNAGGMAGLAPRAIINLQDLTDTGLIRPGSRVQYKLMLAGNNSNLKQYHLWLKDRLKPGEQWRDPQQSSSSSKLLQRIRTFLGISTMIALLLGISALAFSGYRFAEEQQQRVALWRCLGIAQNQLIRQYFNLMFLLALLGGIVGITLGWLLSHFILQLLASFITVPALSFNLTSALTAIVTGFILVAVFLFPAVYQAANRPPLTILRPQSGHLSVPFLHWLPGIATVILIALYWSDNWKLWLAFSVAILLLALLLHLAGSLLTGFFSSLARRRGGTLAIVSKMIKTNRKTIALQMLVTSLILSLFGLIFLASQGLFQQWQKELPQHTPNLFLFNVSPEDVTAIQADFTEMKINRSEWYPIARGRLVKLNDVNVQQSMNKKQRQDNALKRELNLTYSQVLAADNEIIEGSWPPATVTATDGSVLYNISIEQGLAERLGFKLGDSLTFAVGSEAVQGVISSIRKVHWDSFKPNFFIIFPQQAFDNIAVTLLSSFYVPKNKLATVARKLKKYPSVSMIPVDKVLSQLRALISQAGMILQLSMGFIAILAFILVLTVLQITYKERLLQGLVIRAVGGGNRLMHQLLLTEWLILGAISGIVAAIFVELGYALIAVGLLDLKPQFHPAIWFLLPVIAFTILMLSGQGLRRHLTHQSPLLLLKEQMG